MESGYTPAAWRKAVIETVFHLCRRHHKFGYFKTKIPTRWWRPPYD